MIVVSWSFTLYNYQNSDHTTVLMQWLMHPYFSCTVRSSICYAWFIACTLCTCQRHGVVMICSTLVCSRVWAYRFHVNVQLYTTADERMTSWSVSLIADRENECMFYLILKPLHVHAQVLCMHKPALQSSIFSKHRRMYQQSVREWQL